jgi:hypothetical protein
VPVVSDVDKPSPLRLQRKHGEGRTPDATPEDGARLVRAQSLRNAITASLIVIILFCPAWVALTSLTNRVFPWMTVVLGGALGIAVQRTGRGLDWRFPALAAGLTLVGALLSGVVVAASTTAAEYDTGTMHVLQAVTSMTWPVFFDEAWNIADAFFAGVAAGFAAFLAPRRLTREQRFALRLWRERSDRHQ